jgi:CheY-like chemotaxis protein
MNTILVVEDDELSRDALTRRLERRGYRVVPAGDGHEAVELAQAAPPPDLILMDLGLPRLDGWTATRYLKTAPATQDIPIIIVSAHVTGADRQAALAAGGDDLDTKPLQFEGLVLKINELLKKRAQAG